MIAPPGSKGWRVSTEERPAAARAADDSNGFDLESVDRISGQNLLTFRLNVLNRLISRQLNRYLGSNFGLSVAEWWVLVQLSEHSPRTLRWLAATTYADKAQLSRAAASLVKKGYVRRRLDPKDARSVLLSVTGKGVRLKDVIQPVRREFNRSLLNQLSPEEREVLHSAVDTLSSFLLSDGEHQ
jgi:DNA-binding MarR family transcriptional regulator